MAVVRREKEAWEDRTAYHGTVPDNVMIAHCKAQKKIFLKPN
jgi:hypothetical protein